MFNNNPDLPGERRVPGGHEEYRAPRQQRRLENGNRPLEEKTHMLVHPALIPPENGKNYYSLLP